ncbi:hypothetical protein NA57DRAFT_44110 [Rhizodiscina lignyota]|uniref:Alpha/beta-hydrolase n=1 Tax=Rhizodiscina lignyota TaxID=1504668 RepID=A0A9P4I5P7_9PEZI|nr:hypothetical protein NA57DRAFT_44110 [Rhizodiscina lignyota]
MTSSPGNPMAYTYSSPVPPVSSTVYPVAGILTTVYGLSELPPNITEIACLWLLHPRLQTQACMAPLAAHTITQWNERIRQGKAGKKPKGLIAASFDARNHGSREVDKIANEAWRQGNERHAIDMFSCYHGSALDTTLLLTHLPSYIHPSLPTSAAGSKPILSTNIVLGISLGGHTAWSLLLSDPRISAAVSIIGCPDYMSLMHDRARLSKIKAYTTSSPPGSKFFGSDAFPPALVDAVRASDPAGLLSPFGSKMSANAQAGAEGGISLAEKRRLRSLFKERLQGKSILLLSGGSDKMVPYRIFEPFLKYLKGAAAKGGFFEDGQFTIEDHVYAGVGHATTREMAGKAEEWICDWLAGEVRREAKL